MKNMHHFPPLLALIAVLPVAVMSCSPLESAPAFSSLCLAYSNFSKAGEASSLDILVYNNYAPYLLDSYQHFDSLPERADVASSVGDKILVGVALPEGSKFSYDQVRSYESLSSAVCYLNEENPSCPTMSGVCLCNSDALSLGTLELKPALCRVVLEKVTLKMDEDIYKGKTMTLRGAYLINVSGICPIIEGRDSVVSEIINYGRLDKDATARLSCPGMLYSSKAENAAFYCFPVCGQKGYGIGKAPTRLVVEACMDSVTYYYPITLPDMKRGCEYRYSLTITRTGCLDPDTEAFVEGVDVKVSMGKWKEFEDEIIDY